ncbi:MAG: hypothetical protein ACFE8P_12705 [Promethearchaeota archaeon]
MKTAFRCKKCKHLMKPEVQDFRDLLLLVSWKCENCGREVENFVMPEEI